MKTVDDLVQTLERAAGRNLLSAVLYGSAVSGDTTRHFSDVDLFLLLNDTEPASMGTILPALREWVKSGNKTPLVFSKAHFDRAADVFPIEFSEIRDRRRVLAGSDPFTAVRIDNTALRHQLEFELRTNLLRLRRHHIELGDKPKHIGGVLAQSLSTFSALFRSVLRLRGEPAPATQKETWTALNRHVALDMAALEKIWDLRDHGIKLDQKSADDLTQRLIKNVENTIHFVDTHK
jgi:predicted nucleotidyltransferase